jgi:acetoacetyl-CoA reductase
MIIENIIDNQASAVKQWHSVCDNFLNTFNAYFDSSYSIINTYTENFSKLSTGNALREKYKPTLNKHRKLTTAVITGGIGGIGTAICRRLAKDSNRIVSTYISSEKAKAEAWKAALEKEGYTAEIFECDVADYQACQNFAGLIEKKYGSIDILVNGAGITRDVMLRKMEKEMWDAVIDTNLDSVFNMTRSFINGMIKSGYGRIINISSVNGQKGQFGQTNYSTAKAGMIGFSRSLALELADKGITVNCICPGYVGTSMVQAIREDVLNTIIQQIPMKRLAKVEEIADAVAFLADKNSGYITGTELAVNGGLWMG